MDADVVEHLQQKWNACDAQNQVLQAEVERLSQELTEIQHRQQIAVRNSYTDGYEAGLADERKRWVKRPG